MAIKVHHLRPAPGAKKDKTRKGRGEASKGKTAGRGTKGSGARRNYSAAFEGGQMPIQRRLPKFGFKNINRVEFVPLNLDKLEYFAEQWNVTKIDVAWCINQIESIYLSIFRILHLNRMGFNGDTTLTF